MILILYIICIMLMVMMMMLHCTALHSGSKNPKLCQNLFVSLRLKGIKSRHKFGSNFAFYICYSLLRSETYSNTGSRQLSHQRTMPVTVLWLNSAGQRSRTFITPNGWSVNNFPGEGKERPESCQQKSSPPTSCRDSGSRLKKSCIIMVLVWF